MKYDYLIVGSGLSGATVAKIMSYAAKRVMIIERRDHVGGNCHDVMMGGTRVSLYGGHIFHTNSDAVWRFVNRFSGFIHYEHRVKVRIGDMIYSFPPNKMTEQQLGLSRASQAEKLAIYLELFYRGFSEKAWGRPWEQLPNGIKARVPIRDNWDDRYFTDRYQGLPEYGYTEMIKTMIAGIPLELNCDFCADYEYWRNRAHKVFYSGALDELMEYEFGRLEYRSLRFEHEIMDTDDYQGCPTLNYPERDVPWTVVNEWKHYGWHRQPENRTVITRQFPASFEETGERYYPYIDEENRQRYARYVSALEEGIIPIGRLGKFMYYNMDQAIASAIEIAKKELRA